MTNTMIKLPVYGQINTHSFIILIFEPPSELECLARVKRHIEHGDVKCKCPELCKDTQYRQSVSSSEWPGDTLIEILNTTFAGRSDALDAAMVDEESIRRNLLKIDVFFEDLQYDLVVEMEAYGVSESIVESVPSSKFYMKWNLKSKKKKHV